MKKLLLPLTLFIFLIGCVEVIDVLEFPQPKPTSGIESLSVSPDFNFSNSQDINLQISADGVFVFPQQRILYELYAVGSDTVLLENSAIEVGKLKTRVMQLANHVEGLLLDTYYMGYKRTHYEPKNASINFNLTEPVMMTDLDSISSLVVSNGRFIGRDRCTPDITVEYEKWYKGNQWKIKSSEDIDMITLKLGGDSQFTIRDPREYDDKNKNHPHWDWKVPESFPYKISDVQGIHVYSRCKNSNSNAVGAYLPNPYYEAGNADQDGDGIEDNFDIAPEDPSIASFAYVPAQDVYHTLAFEDNWPAKGDYDFNDLVIGYNYRIWVNGSGHVSGFDYDIQFRALGASFDNDFAVIFNDPDNSATLTNADESRIDQELINSNTKTILRFNQVKQIYQGSGYVNVNYTGENIDVRNVTGTVLLGGSVELADFDLEGFLMINQQAGREVHLPDMPPSSLADLALFGAADDDSRPENGRYYKTAYHLPWVLDIPAAWEHPLENKDITSAYGRFKKYAEEDHSLVWYTATPVNQNPDKVFKKQ